MTEAPAQTDTRLIDEFAKAALQGLLAGRYINDGKAEIARECYQWAAAMVIAREKMYSREE